MTTKETNQLVGTPRCSVIVTTWKRPILLRDTLGYLMSQSYPNIEVIVVCDGEDGDLRAIAQAFEGDILVRWVFHPENRGLPAARNTGAREAEGEIVLFLDDDVSADSELVAVHMHHHITADQSRKVAVCGITAEGRNTQFSSYVNESLHEAWNLSLETLAATLAATEADSIGEETERNMWFGLNCSIRRNLFLVNGGFNEYFRASDEEMEMGLRLHLAGVEFIFEPRLLLTHKNSKDLTGYFRRCWGTSGKVDVYRVFDLGQRNEQTKRLASIYHGYLLDRLTARCCWHTSRTLQTVAKGLEKAANRTGSRLLVGAWARTSQAGEYWSHAKDAGCTLERLKSVIGPSKCALMLHSVCEPLSKEEASYYIAPRRFHRLMRWFRATGYKTATTAQWLQNDVPEKHVLLSFDDGYDDLYDELLPLVIEHHYTPVIYLVVDRIGASNVWDQKNGLRTRNLLTLEQIREMQKYGVEFGSHTLTHPWLPSLSDAELRREVSDSKHRLEDILGVEITSFAYPTGGVDRRVRSAVADAGYKLAFTINFGLNWWNDPLCQRRVEINDYTSVLDFAFKLRTGYSFGLSVAKRLKDLEQKLPTKVLRNTAGGLRSVGRRVFRKFSPGE